MRCLALFLLACATGAVAAPAGVVAPARLAWLDHGEIAGVQQGAAPAAPAAPPATWRTPLGSSWKVFVYAYLHDTSAAEPVYRCTAAERQPDDDYCCDPGGSADRDQALARSCGPYFAPQRLGLSAGDWQRYWRGRSAPDWLLSLPALQPGTALPVTELLRALASVSGPARVAARRALLPVSLRDEALLAAVGSGPRFKTWSWTVDGAHRGGAAGWWADGSPLWFGAPGAGRNALHQQAGWLGEQARRHAGGDPPDADTVAAQPCIAVRFFQRYPLRSVSRADGLPAAAGPMNGRYRLAFDNGQALAIVATPALQLRRDAGKPTIEARLPLEDYVARVVDREGRADEPEAARALAVAARSYVLQNAGGAEGCREIADDSRTQRVGPDAPSAAARAAAGFTLDLVLDRPVRYHRDQAAPGVMSWRAAVDAGRAGQGFAVILGTAYPQARLVGLASALDCAPLPEAADWLAARQQRWRRVLLEEPGYEPLDDGLHVCRLAMGVPHSDQRALVIRIREWSSREGRVTLIHEYLHLAFRRHPNGRDEGYVERLARRLADT